MWQPPWDIGSGVPGISRPLEVNYELALLNDMTIEYNLLLYSHGTVL